MRTVKAHYKLSKVAALTDVGVRFWKQRVKAGDVKGFLLGGEFVIEAESLVRFLEKQRVRTPEELAQRFN